MPRRLLVLVLAPVLLLAGCAKRPVLYPNHVHRSMGEATAQEVVDDCLEQARQADVADTRTEGAAKRGAGGALMGGIVGGLVGLIFGNPGRGAAAGATGAGSTGAIEGATRSGESAPNFRSYVEACLREQGLQPVGWK